MDSSISHSDLAGPYLPNIRMNIAPHIRLSQSQVNEHTVVSSAADSLAVNLHRL